MDNQQPSGDYHWEADINRSGMPVAVLNADKLIVARIYLSPDRKVLRIALPEMSSVEQVKIDTEHRLIDFRRRL